MGGLGWRRRGVKEDAGGDVGGEGGLEVSGGVSDHDRLGEIDGVVVCGLKEHAGLRFAAGAGAGELRVMRAVVDGGEGATVVFKLGFEPLGEVLVSGFCIEAPCDTGLVGDDDELVALSYGGLAEFENPFCKHAVFWFMKVIDVYVDDAVAVEEEGFGHGLRYRLRVRIGRGRSLRVLRYR